jgi:hypothetical protein
VIEELKKLILDFDDDMKTPGKYVSEICKNYEAIDIQSVIIDILSENDIDEFEKSLYFLIFLYKNVSYIPGDYELDVVSLFKESDSFQTMFENEIRYGNYAKSTYFMDHLDELPLILNDESLEKYLNWNLEKSPLLIKFIINYFVKNNKSKFPNDIYNKIRFENKDLEAISKYNVIESWLIDPIQKIELLEELKFTINSSFIDFIKIRLNEYKEISDGNFINEEEIKKNIFDEILEDYFNDSVRWLTEGNPIAFEDYLNDKLRNVV